jgi:hypothetical protein
MRGLVVQLIRSHSDDEVETPIQSVMSKRGIDQVSGSDASGTGDGADTRRIVKESMAVQVHVSSISI